ncbi:MAG TPA: hypothetical protein VG602_06755 [Actinomycetota bacterium]|nr:hypothetical protein [Actinomycetota bacterium]
MTGGERADNGYRRALPRLPTGIIAVSVVVALVAVSGLIYLLYRETRGPGEILRRFAQAVDDGDCAGSYELLHEDVTARIPEEEWCARLPSVDEQIDAGFRLEEAVLQGDEARVTVEDAGAEEWRLGRFGERSWRVLGPAPAGF